MKIMNMRKGSWGKLTAFFDVCTDEGFIIKGFKLVNGINGMFVGFPSQKGNDDEYYDTIWLTEEVRESMREKLNKMAVTMNAMISDPKPDRADRAVTGRVRDHEGIFRHARQVGEQAVLGLRLGCWQKPVAKAVIVLPSPACYSLAVDDD